MRTIAVVTGGNRGIGFEVCRQLVRHDIEVVLTSRDEAKGQKSAQKLRNEGLTATAYQLDVTQPESISRLERFLRSEYGRLDILVNNAGVFLDRSEGILEVGLDKLHTTFETNLFGALMMCQALVPLMRENRYGRVVNVSSRMGQLSMMGARSPTYRMSKVALNAMTRLLAAEVRDDGILVNAASPGWVRTRMGGPNALRSSEEGADTIVWLATLPDDGPTGGFFQDRKPLEW